mgnify:FL=1|jgi:hypothetical protein
MKRIGLFFLVLGTCLPVRGSDFSVDFPKYTNVFKTSLIGPAWGSLPFTSEYRLLYEVSTGKYQSVQAGISYFGKSPFLQSFMGSGGPSYFVRGHRIQYMHRFFFRAPEFDPIGWYIGPMASYAMAKYSLYPWIYKNRYVKAEHSFFAIVVGKQVRWWKRFYMDMFTGMGYKKNRVTQFYPNNTTKPVDLGDWDEILESNIKLTFGFNVGFGF